jgi:hypothetical protein
VPLFLMYVYAITYAARRPGFDRWDVLLQPGKLPCEACLSQSDQDLVWPHCHGFICHRFISAAPPCQLSNGPTWACGILTSPPHVDLTTLYIASRYAGRSNCACLGRKEIPSTRSRQRGFAD